MNAVSLLLPLSGVASGCLLGYVARRNFFCTLSAFEQHWYGENSDGLRTWVLTAALSIIGVQTLIQFSIIDLSQSHYLGTSFNWLSAVVGGIAFGIGMALVGTCGFGALVRLGGGSLKSLIALLVLALFAISTARGLLALGRTGLFDPIALELDFAANQSIPALVQALTGTDMRLAVTLVIAGPMMVWVLSDPVYRRQPRAFGTAAAIAAVVIFGWVVTALAAANSFAAVQVESTAFVQPVADTLLQFIFAFGTGPDYGVGLVVGTVAGAAIAARSADNVRWEACDDARELSRHIIGAALMGSGGILALGCTIGQGLSAASLLTISAPVVIGSIALGARLGLAWMVEGSFLSVLRQ